jgi:hypothetical protein
MQYLPLGYMAIAWKDTDLVTIFSASVHKLTLKRFIKNFICATIYAQMVPPIGLEPILEGF